MKSNLYLELTDRTKQIFKTVVESYLETGSPSGSETVLKKVICGVPIRYLSSSPSLSNCITPPGICYILLNNILYIL